MEPGVVSLNSKKLDFFLHLTFHLQGWAFKAGFPEHNVAASLVADSTVVVGEGDASGGAGDWHPRQWVALRVGPLAGGRNVRQLPALRALAPHIDRPVLTQCAAVKPFKVVPLFRRVEGPRVDAAVAVDGAVGVAEAVPLPPVHLQRAARTPAKVARVSLWTVLACFFFGISIFNLLSLFAF